MEQFEDIWQKVRKDWSSKDKKKKKTIKTFYLDFSELLFPQVYKATLNLRSDGWDENTVTVVKYSESWEYSWYFIVWGNTALVNMAAQSSANEGTESH